MALISIRNIVAPFENKTHLFTIVVIAIIFGVWRASGGSLTSQPTKDEPRFQTEQGFSNRTLGDVSSAQPASKRLAPKTPSSASRDKLDALLVPQQQLDNPTATQKQHSALDDIEKSLGMR